MSDRHHRRCPKGNQEPQHDRMADELVEAGDSETQVGVFPVTQIQVYLPQPEQVKVVDHEGTQEDDQPTDKKDSLEQDLARGILYHPNKSGDGSPLPVQKQEREAGEQNERASLDGPGDDLRPQLLKTDRNAP